MTCNCYSAVFFSFSCCNSIFFFLPCFYKRWLLNKVLCILKLHYTECFRFHHLSEKGLNLQFILSLAFTIHLVKLSNNKLLMLSIHRSHYHSLYIFSFNLSLKFSFQFWLQLFFFKTKFQVRCYSWAKSVLYVEDLLRFITLPCLSVCDRQMGIRNQRIIEDTQLTSSSFSDKHGPELARLSENNYEGSWMPA